MSLLREIVQTPKDTLILTNLRLFPVWLKHHEYQNYFVHRSVEYILFIHDIFSAAINVVCMLPTLISQVLENFVDSGLIKITRLLTNNHYEVNAPESQWPSFDMLKKRRAAHAVHKMHGYTTNNTNRASEYLKEDAKLFDKSTPIILEETDTRRRGWSRVKGVLQAFRAYFTAPKTSNWTYLGYVISALFFLPLILTVALFEVLVRPVLHVTMIVSSMLAVLYDIALRLIVNIPLYIHDAVYHVKKTPPPPSLPPDTYALLMQKVEHTWVDKDAYNAQLSPPKHFASLFNKPVAEVIVDSPSHTHSPMSTQDEFEDFEDDEKEAELSSDEKNSAP